MNPLLLAQLCANIYTSANGLVTYDADGVYAGYCGVESANTFVFRGSDNVAFKIGYLPCRYAAGSRCLLCVGT